MGEYDDIEFKEMEQKSFWVPPELYRKFKAKVALNDETLSRRLIKLMQQWINEDNQGGSE